MIELLTKWTFLFFNVSFISYFYLLKKKNKNLLKQLDILEKTHENENIKEIYKLRNENILLKDENSKFRIDTNYLKNDLASEFKFYQKINTQLNKELVESNKSLQKYKISYEKVFLNNKDLVDDNNQLRQDIDNLADSYKILYTNNQKLINNNNKSVDDTNELEDNVCSLEADIFMYKNTIDTLKNRNTVLEEIESSQNINIIKLRNKLKNFNKNLKFI